MEKHIIEEPIAGVNWHVARSAKTKEFQNLARIEGFHTLDMEDCSHPHRLAKVVDRPEYMFIVAKAAHHDAKAGRLTFENVDIFINAKTLVTVVENSSPIPERIVRRFADKAVKPTPLNIGYAILDEIVDEYLLMLDAVGETVNALEASVVKHTSSATLQRIFSAKRSLIDFRRNAGGMREVVSLLIRHPRVRTGGELENYYRDLYEHAIRVIEFIETCRDVLNGSLDNYLSAVAERTNETTKVLAVYGTIALPFIVITGMYGMNIPLPFQESPHAFFIVFAFMAFTALIALAFFKKKGWF